MNIELRNSFMLVIKLPIKIDFVILAYDIYVECVDLVHWESQVFSFIELTCKLRISPCYISIYNRSQYTVTTIK